VRREAEAKAHLEEAKRDLDLYYVDEVLDDEDVFQMIVEKGFQPTSEDALAAAGDDGEGRGCSDRHQRLTARSLGDSGAEPFHGGQGLLDVVSFSPAFGERGAGKKSIAPCAELAVHMPASKLTDRLPQVRFPHHGLRISAGHALAVLACRARLMRTDRDGGDGGDGGGQGPMGGARGGSPGAIHRDSGCVSAGLHDNSPGQTTRHLDGVPDCGPIL